MPNPVFGHPLQNPVELQPFSPLERIGGIAVNAAQGATGQTHEDSRQTAGQTLTLEGIKNLADAQARPGFGTVVGWVTIAVFAALGALLLIAGAAGMLQMVLLLWRGRQTTATVVADTSRHKNPKFRFTDDYGQTHVVSEAVQSWHRRYHADQQVTLVYLPERPEAFVVDRFADKWGILSFFFILGLIILFPCVLFMFGPARFISVLGRVDILAPLVFLIFGAVMLTLGLALLRKTLRFRQRLPRQLESSLSRRCGLVGTNPVKGKHGT